MNRYTSTWADDDVETIKRMWAAGESASRISEALDGRKSRGAVLGKIGRLGLLGSGGSGEAARKAVEERSAEREAAKKATQEKARLERAARRAAEAAAREKAREKVSARVIPMPNVIICHPVILRDLEGHQCHFPLDERGEGGHWLYCGAKAAIGSPYCAGHHRIVYPPVERPQRKRRAA